MEREYEELVDKLTALSDVSLHFVNVRAFLVSYRDYEFLEMNMNHRREKHTHLCFNGIPLWKSDSAETNNPRIVL